MQNIPHNWVKSINAMQKKKRLWIQGSCIAGCLVVFCTFYALILPAITMEYGERTLDCPLSVHAHTDECKNEEGEQICGQADFVVHTHEDGCYDTEGTLTCLLPEVEEHTHTEECYTSETELICTTEVHVHDDSCYEKTTEASEETTEASEEAESTEKQEPVLICTKGEHSHGDACYESKSVLTCEKEEVSLHSHGEDCYETNEDEEEVLICTMLEVMEHVHSDGCFVEVDTDADSEEESQATSLPAETETTALVVEEKGDADAVVMAADTGDAAVVASGTCGANATWVLTDDGVLTISGTGAMKNYSSYYTSNPPWYSKRGSITSVVVGEGITSIGNYAFYYCSKVTSITMPTSITTVGQGAFNMCSALTGITLPEGLISIGDETFYNCKGLTSITLPESVTSIGDKAFYGCVSLASITIPQGVTSIGSSAFYNCDRLTSITIPDGVTSLGSGVFGFSDRLTNIHVSEGNPCYVSVDGVLFDKTTTMLIQYPAGKTDQSYAIPEGVTSISDSAFSGCRSLTSIDIPVGVTSIGNKVFYYCDSLTSIDIPVGVTSIGSEVFYGCDSLTSIDIPEGVTSIGKDAFRGCNNLISITLPKGITSIGSSAFYKCNGLASITLQEGLVSIGSYAFVDCDSLTSIDIPAGVTSIGSEAFYDCDSLTSVNISGSVTSIGSSAFESCGSLTRINIPEGITSIRSGTFAYCSSLTSITIPESVTSIGSKAFYYCHGLTSITLPAGLTSIGKNAFSKSNIKCLTLQTGVISINSEAGFSKLEHITIGDQVDTLDLGVLETFAAGSTVLNLITFEDSNYFTCTGNDFTLGKLTLTAGEYYVAEHGVLYRLKDDGTVMVWYVPEALPCTAYSILDSVPSQSDSEIVYTVTAIQDRAFQDCDTLTEVTIPETVTSVGSWAFYQASSLASVNGETSLSAVLNKWRSAGANSSTFANTALWDSGAAEVYTVTADIIKVFDSTGREISLSISADKDVLTGQPVQSTLTIEEGNEDSVDVIRVYFQFESSAGSLGYEVGTYDFKINDSEKISVNFCQSNVENIYYVEVPSILAGQTLSLNLPSMYANYSAGGTALIWLDVLTQDEAKTLDNGITEPTVVHLATWGTKADTFPVSKTASASTVDVKGDGTDSNQVSPDKLMYTISMSRDGDTLDCGKDLMTSVDFVDTLTLPEPFEWRKDVVEAIRNGYYSFDYANGSAEIRWEVELDGKTVTLASLEKEKKVPYKNQVLWVDEAGNIQIGWTIINESSDTEINDFSAKINIFKSMIVADSADLAEDLEEAKDTVTYSFQNTISATQHFTHSGDQYQSDTAVKDIAIGAADFEITKYCYDGDSYMGGECWFVFELTNDTALPYTALDCVTDPVPDYHYITSADMETMFYTDSYGKDLAIYIKNATLTETVSRTVIGTDGKQYTITQQNEGTETDYEDKATTDSSLITDSATITIAWSEDKSYLILTASYENTVITRTIGTGKDCGSIQEALDGIGYLITEPACYTCIWDIEGNTLYSGEERRYHVRASNKDTFMRLTGDQDWYIIKGTEYARSFNYAYAYTTDGSYERDSNFSDISRDFTLNKEAYLNGELTEQVEAGDVLNYRIDVAHAGDAAYDALPLVDNMEGGQVLLVLASENTGLSDSELETYETEGKTYYLLNKPGTYEKVQVGTHLADRVVVTETDSGLDTMIYWYLTEVSGDVTVTVEYPALVSPEKAGLIVEGDTFKLSNEVWLNDHETHRLYDGAFLDGTVLRMNKYIVTNVDSGELYDLSHHDYTKDILSERTNIHAGETVVYRLLLAGVNGPVMIKGSSMYDVLPASLNNYWSKENVTVTYVQTEGTEATIQNGDAWYIETDPKNENQQYLRWGEDFSATIDGTLYIYVTLTCPSGSQWADYGHAYGNQDVCNTFHVYQLQDEVFHYLSVSAEVLLQKGVYKTGVVVSGSYMEAVDAQSLWYYTNDTQAKGMVTYYVTLYNGGDTRVYLSTLQDVLPRGFTFRALYTSDTSVLDASSTASKSCKNYGYNSLASLNVAEGKPLTYKQAYIQVSTAANSSGQETVHFSFSNTEDGGNLCYDKKIGKYYLDTGEALVFAYHCATNGYTETEDDAINTIAMPYYDYNGAGANLNTVINVDRKNVNGFKSNNGSCAVLTTGQVKLIGMDSTGADNSTQWIGSEVTVRRGSILPGITKSAQVPFATPADTVAWNIQVSNSGIYDMRNYIITDVMMAPYQFTGSVGYKIYFNAWENSYVENTNLFTFGERNPGDTEVTITSDKGSAQLTVNGEYQELTSSVGRYTVTLEVRISRDDGDEGNGIEILSIRFPEDEYKAAAIPAGGTAVMTLHTKNFGDSYANTTYFNTSYITPSADQPFDTGAVSQGNYTIFDEKDSVVSEANVAVAYGYATSSQKSVAELENLENTAVSTDSTNSIVLPDAGKLFRYTLTVNNTGGDSVSKAMDKLVLIDNLPQKDDHVTFYPDIPRYSEFKVDFADADELDFDVSVNGTSLDPNKYVVEFSEKTEFGSEDWKGTETDGWVGLSNVEKLSDMRSFRVKILDETGTLIPADAVITASFNARIDTSEGVPESSSVAWNSFGYRYSLLNDGTELEAAPQKVGVKMPSVPVLVKELVGSNGDAYSASEDVDFRFVIYEGEAVDLPEGYTEANVFTALSEKKFTVVDLTVEAGKSTSNAKKLDDLNCWSYTDGVLAETAEAWNWSHLSRYTIVELPLSADSVYTFGAFDRIHPNNYTFSYNAASNRTITCSNVRDVWEILVSKTCETTQKPLSGAVFGIYSTKESDKISDENFEALTASLRTKPEKKVESWYLMDIQTTNADGTIRWSGLTEESYYVQELQAPDGYSFEQEGKVLTRGNGNSVTIEVTNKPGYKLPETGGPGTKLLTTAGLLLMVTTLVLLFKRRWDGVITG